MRLHNHVERFPSALGFLRLTSREATNKEAIYPPPHFICQADEMRFANRAVFNSKSSPFLADVVIGVK